MIRRGRFFLITIVLISASPPQTAEDWERSGNAFFADDNYTEAARCYARAEERGSDPGRVAFNHGAALFRMGKYRDAERLFRCAVESAGPSDRSAKALYNLGTCLLQLSEGKDAPRLAEAIDCFTRCLKTPGLSDDLSNDARHNLELTKVLWRAVRGGSAAPPENESSRGEDDRPPDKPPENGPTSDPASQPGTPDPRGNEHVSPMPGSGTGPKPTPAQNQPQPGTGQMSPIPADQQLQPLPPAETRELLRIATDRIRREHRKLQHGNGTAEPKSYPDY